MRIGLEETEDDKIYDKNGNITVERNGEYNNGYVYESVLVGTLNDGRDIYRLNWAIGIEEQPKIRADVYQKSYEYDERDRLIYARDNFSLYGIYRYDESGERSNKYNYFSEEETLYTNRYFSTSINSLNREYEGQSIKHIFLNNERLVTKTALNKINGTEHAYRDYEKSHTYYYHSDHLGSATLITDYKGKEYQRVEYTPYGESWIELSKNIDNYLPYKFTGKELDEETGFYYYGQRYLDPRYSIWHTSDLAIYDYMSQSKEGGGGIYNVTNLNLYHYAGNNPVRYIDPDGRFLHVAGVSAGMQVAAGALASGAGYATNALVTGQEETVEGAVTAMAAGAAGVMFGMALDKAANAIATASSKASTPALSSGVPALQNGDTVYRVYGGDSSPNGASWTTVNPSSVPNYRDAAGLPSGGLSKANNTGRFVLERVVKDSSQCVKSQFASPLDGMKGGIPEYIIPNALNNGSVELTGVFGVNSEF